MNLRNIVLPLIASAIGSASAQFAVNPQLGINYTNLTNPPSNVTTSAAVGFQLGADLRFGDRLYFQPGAFFGRSATVVKFSPLDTTFIEDNLIRTTAKVKALIGYNIIHGDAFRLRVNAGPTYEALLSVDSKDDKIAFNKSDYNGGSFNMDGGLGVDLSGLDALAAFKSRMDADAVGNAVAYMASLPLDANVLFMTVMATKMPFVGRG